MNQNVTNAVQAMNQNVTNAVQAMNQNVTTVTNSINNVITAFYDLIELEKNKEKTDPKNNK
jgi:hypothetical protein